MRKLAALLPVLLFAAAASGHNTDPVNNATMTVSYQLSPGPGKISVTHVPGEGCVVVASAVEIVVTSPLLAIQNAGPQPALDVFLSVSAIRHPSGGSEDTAVHLSWHATGTNASGLPDADCNGSGDVVFKVTVVEGVDVPPPPPITVGTTDAVAGDPVSAATGALYDFFDDINLRGPLPIMFGRYYASTLTADGATSGALGTNWMHSYELRLTVSGATAKVVSYQGQSIRFTQGSGGTWLLASAGPLIHQLLQSGATFRFLDPASRCIYTFNNAAGGRLERIEDRNGNAVTLAYAGNLLTQVQDGLGATLAFTYTGGGKLASVKDQAGRTVAFAYTGDNLTASTDPSGRTTTYAYTSTQAAGALLVAVTLPRGNARYAQVYDANGRVVTQTDAGGNVTGIAYNTPAPGATTVTDALGTAAVLRHQGMNLVDEASPYVNASKRSYDGNNRITSQEDSNGARVTYTYHAPSGLLASIGLPDGTSITLTYAATTSGGFTYYDVTKVTFQDGTTETYTYDASGNLTGRTDRSGQAWLATYNARGQIASLRLPTGAMQLYTYNADATLASLAVPGAGAATFAYDSLKRVTQKSRAGGVTRSFVYDALGGFSSYTDPDGATTRYTRDANGLALAATDALGGTATFARSGDDLVTGMTDAAGQTVQIGYDKLHRLASIRLQDSSLMTFGYTPAGKRAVFTDGAGKSWNREFDAAGRPIAFVTPLGYATDLVRDAMGRVRTILEPTGNLWQLGYDAAGRATSVADPAGGTTRIAYNARGFVTGIELSPAVAATYTRDALANITDVRDPNGNHWLSTYDSAGRLASLADPLGNAQAFVRNAAGRIAVATSAEGTLNITTNAAGRVTAVAGSDGTSLAFAYNAIGQTTSATGAAFQYDIRGLMSNSNGIALQRDAGGRIAQMTLGADKTVQYTYDARGLPVQVRDWQGGVTAISYDDDGHIAAIARPNGTTTSYAYDASGEIAAITENAGAAVLASVSLLRDRLGRTVQATRNAPLLPTAEQLNALQATRSVDAASQIAGFAWDHLGRRLADNRRSYTWDLASRLVAFSAGALAAQLGYNAFGHLASDTRAGSARQYAWNYATELPTIAVARNNGADLRYFVHTPAGELLYSIDADGTRRYHHYDEMGNTLFLTDAAGAVTDKYAYSPWGELLASTGSSDNVFTFAGRYGAVALGSGLYSMRRRVYDSATASFLSRDPVARLDPRLINPYQYAAGNPLALVDKTGEDPTPAGNAVADATSTALTAGGQLTSVAAPIAQSIESTIDPLNLYILTQQAKTVEETPKDINAAFQVFKKVQSAPQVQANASKLKVVGKAGNALALANVAFEGVKLNGAIENAQSEYDNNQSAEQAAFNNAMLALWQLYKEKKIGLVDYRRRRLQMIFNFEDQQMASDDLLDTKLWLSGANFVKDSLTALTPVPGAAFDQLSNFGGWVIGK